MKYKATRTEP